VRDHRIDLDLALHVPVDDFRHVGAAARAAEGRALPDAPGHQLEWAGRDLRAGRRDAANGSENVLCCGRVIFAVVALFHLVRIYMDWPVMIGDWSVPMWVSWIGLVVAGGLAFFGLRLAERHAR
jgi:hypothetical protein